MAGAMRPACWPRPLVRLLPLVTHQPRSCDPSTWVDGVFVASAAKAWRGAVEACVNVSEEVALLGGGAGGLGAAERREQIGLLRLHAGMARRLDVAVALHFQWQRGEGDGGRMRLG